MIPSESSRVVSGVPTLSAVLRDLMRRPTYTATPGLLSKLSGLPRATIINWLEGRVSKPRHWRDLIKVADALRLGDVEIEALLGAADYPPLAVLNARAPDLCDGDSAMRAPHRSAPLPRQATELVGRDFALSTVRERLCRDGIRLVTLVGTGGVGKTHLAIAIAEAMQAAFAGGIVWIPLAAIDDPSQVPSVILQALGIRETSAASTMRSLTQALQAERVLLLLDNFEQLLAAAPCIGELLEHTLHVKVLVTSRAALRIRGESEYRVSPLELPDAVSLFVKRSQAYRGDFMLTQHNAQAIAAICTRVDGLPLALELAAARTNVLSPEELLRRLESPLTLLTNGTRDSSFRQQTLRNTIAWSYTLLSKPQQKLFRRLAVLGGGIGFPAAAAIAEVDVLNDVSASNDLFEMLASLVDQSLLCADTSLGDGEPRFTMLETIREYALELLSEHSECAAAKRLHALYFLHLSEAADVRFALEPTIAWVRSLQVEHENVRSALLYFLEEADDVPRAARVVAALGRYWFEKGLFREARLWLERIRSLQYAIEPVTHAKILLYLAFVANYESDYEAGAEAASQALDAYTRTGDRTGSAHALNASGIAAMYTGRYDRAEHFFNRALSAYRALDDERGVAVALHNLGEIASECRFDFNVAERRYEESLTIFRRLGHTMNVGSTLGVLAELRAHRGNIADARDLGSQALATYRELDNQPLIAEELTRLARYELSIGKIRDARTLLTGAVEHLKMSFHARLTARCFEAFASLAVAEGAYDRAARFLGFTQQLRDAYHLPRLPAWEREYALLAQAVRSGLTCEQYQTQWTYGRSLQVADAFHETHL